MDHRELLKKYINYVGECEGTTFLSWHHGYVEFTDEEWTILQSLDAESLEDWKKANR